RKWKDRVAQLTVDPSGVVTATSTINTPYVEGNSGPGDLPPGAVPKDRLVKQTRARMEAILFNKAVEEKLPTVRLQILDEFVREYPQSMHMAKVNYLYYIAYRQMPDDAKALAAAEQILKK